MKIVSCEKLTEMDNELYRISQMCASLMDAVAALQLRAPWPHVLSVLTLSADTVMVSVYTRIHRPIKWM